MKVNRDINSPLIIPQPVVTGKTDSVLKGKPANQVRPFSEVLNSQFERPEKLKLSAHARRRLDERNVKLSSEDMQKIEGAVKMAEGKGSQESLLIYGDLALVASIKNKTIITAMEGKDMKEHVFTNIDSAVLIR